MSTSVAEINRIVRTSPRELKYLFKSPTEDKRRLTRLISHLVPYRVGIEFETFGAVGQNLFPKESLVLDKRYVIGLNGDRVTRTQDSKKPSTSVDELIRKKLGLVAFREDSHIFYLEPQLNTLYVEGEHEMNEVRISISGYKQLITLYNTLQILSRYLIIPKINGGIHIHIDAPFVREQEGKKFAIEWFNKPAILSEVLQIFEGYTGTYNKRRASEGKGSYIRVSDYPTIEFRIGRLTYDYNTIIRYIIKCSELVRRCKHDAMLSNILKNKVPDEVKCRPLGEFTIELNNGNIGTTTGVTNDVTDLQNQLDALQHYVVELNERFHGIDPLSSSSNYRLYNVLPGTTEYITPF